MSEKDIKVKPQTTTKAVKNAPKSVEHSAKTTAGDIKNVAKDTLVKNAIEKQADTRQNSEPNRAEVEATEQVENTCYSAVDTVYQKGKSFAETKLKEHRQKVKTRENADIPKAPQDSVSEVQNTPKQADTTPKTKESVQNSTSEIKPKNNTAAQVKTKEAYMKSQKADKAENATEAVKTKQNYIKAHENSEIKDGIKQKSSVSEPKTRENTHLSSVTPKTKEQAIKDARKKYVSEKLKTRAETEKAVKENMNLPKQNTEPIKADNNLPKVKSDNTPDTNFSSKAMPKTKESYIRSQRQNTADLIKTPDRVKLAPKQNTHTVTRNVGILLIIIGIIIAIIGIVNLCNLPGTSSVRGDAIMRSIRSKAIFEQQVTCFFTLSIGIIFFISGLVLNKIGNRISPNMIQCQKCGTIQDISNNFCNKCGEKLQGK